MGRVDPLKDVQTMLLVAQEVTRRMPEARFECWGPATPGQEVYADSCRLMHRQLELATGFASWAAPSDPHGVIRSGDLVLMTSISEAMPMTLLEAMGQARPIVATSVGGVPGVVRGCGLVAPPGDVHELAGRGHDPAAQSGAGRPTRADAATSESIDATRCHAAWRRTTG